VLVELVSREGGAISVFARIIDNPPLDGVLVNIVLVMAEVSVVTNSVIGESSLPDFPIAADDRSKGVRVSALDELNGMFKRHVCCGSKQEMRMFRHEDEGVNLKSTFAAVSMESLQEKARVVLDNQQPSTLPRRKGYEIGSGWGDESSWLQEQTSAAKAAVFCLD